MKNKVSLFHDASLLLVVALVLLGAVLAFAPARSQEAAPLAATKTVLNDGE